MNKLFSHFSTITKHKLLVSKLCFRCGLYKQGLLHDLSKYSWVEFSVGVKYYQGNRSPIDKEKEVKGYSLGWLHHKGRNKHHWEYWLDNSYGGVKPIKMPKNYVAEMFCDRVAASMIYQKNAYKDDSALNYWIQGKNHVLVHPDTVKDIEFLLTYLKDNGLDKSIDYIKKEWLKKQVLN